jgi:hypothetical protein
MIVSLKPKAEFLIVDLIWEQHVAWIFLFWRRLCFSEVPELAIVHGIGLKQ